MSAELLTILPAEFARCWLPANAPMPAWATGQGMLVIPDDTGAWIIGEAERMPVEANGERGWRALRLQPAARLASAAGALAHANIPCLSVTQDDVGYLLINAAHFEPALTILTRAGGINNVQTTDERIVIKCAWRTPDGRARLRATFEAEVIEYDHRQDRWLVRLRDLRATDADPDARALIEAQLGRWAYVPSEARRGLTLPLKYETLTGQVRYFYPDDPRQSK